MSNTIKIICYGYRPGTAWTNRFLAYAKSFADLGRKVVFIFLTPDKNNSKLYTNNPNIQCIYLWESDGFLARRSTAISYVRNRLRLKKYIDEGDICFFSDASGFFLREVKMANKRVKIVFESTEHPEVLNRRFNKKLELSIFYSKLKKVDELLVITDSLKTFYINKGYDPQHIHVVNMFVDIARFQHPEKTINEHHIAYCGSVGCKKDGVDILIKSFAKFHELFPHYYLAIYGTGPDKEVEYLRELCEQLGIVSSVKFCGMIPFEEMPQRLVNATILALSRPNNKQNQYGFPTKLGEYLATGNPVVVTAVGEIPRFIIDGKNGYLAIPDSVNSFADKLIQAAQDLISNSSVGLHGKKLVDSDFSAISQVSYHSQIFDFK